MCVFGPGENTTHRGPGNRTPNFLALRLTTMQVEKLINYLCSLRASAKKEDLSEWQMPVED